MIPMIEPQITERCRRRYIYPCSSSSNSLQIRTFKATITSSITHQVLLKCTPYMAITYYNELIYTSPLTSYTIEAAQTRTQNTPHVIHLLGDSPYPISEPTFQRPSVLRRIATTFYLQAVQCTVTKSLSQNRHPYSTFRTIYASKQASS